MRGRGCFGSLFFPSVVCVRVCVGGREREGDCRTKKSQEGKREIALRTVDGDIAHGVRPVLFILSRAVIFAKETGEVA